MKKLNSNHLKIIAITAMTIDHIADLLSPGMESSVVCSILHIIGRITAPIMFFFIAEGYYYTRNVKKYIMRLFIFSIISHFAYCFAFGINYIPFSEGSVFNQTSIMWPLTLSVIALYIANGNNKLKEYQKVLLVILICILAFPGDFSSIAVMAILSIYSNRGNLNKQMLSMMLWLSLYGLISFIFVDKAYGIISLFAILSYPLLKNYNGERGKVKGLKYLFYIYYPLHLVVIGILRIILYGNIPILFN